jgi:phenylalanyl-tRNA synthetase beta chain
MLFLRSWLQDYINLNNYTDQELSDLLSLKSGECEEVNTITDYFGGKVVVGKIMNLYKHPEADKLSVFDVYLDSEGSNKVQIVSAASNAIDGLIIPVALDGAKLPYMTIAAKKMRGFESQGMCCGMSELALETEFSLGLWELNNLVSEDQVGQSICTVLPQYFPVQTTFEIKYLQDRLSQCANHLGLAIEIAICAQNPELLIGDARMIYFGNKFALETLSKIQPID